MSIPIISVDVDELDLQYQDDGVPVACIQVVRLGKRISINLAVLDADDEVYLRITAMGRKPTYRLIKVDPWEDPK